MENHYYYYHFIFETIQVFGKFSKLPLRPQGEFVIDDNQKVIVTSLMYAS